MSARYTHTLRLGFESGANLPIHEGPIHAPSTLKSDLVRISDGAIEFSFERSSRLRPERALYNATRLDQIRRAMLFVCATSSSIPRLQSIEYRDRLEVQTLEPLVSMHGWYTGVNAPVVEAAAAKRVFRNEPVDKAISRALSYICASRRMSAIASQNDRFRYLWSAFNVLYNHVGKTTGKEQEWQRIDNAGDYLKRECSLTRMLDRYAACDYKATLKKLNYYAFLKNRLLVRGGGLKASWRDLLECMDGTLLANSKGAFAKLVSGDAKERLMSEFEQLQQNEHDDALRQVLFLVCTYAYSLRNAFFHGESEYPLFAVREDALLELTADLVELACISIIERLTQE